MLIGLQLNKRSNIETTVNDLSHYYSCSFLRITDPWNPLQTTQTNKCERPQSKHKNFFL